VLLPILIYKKLQTLIKIATVHQSAFRSTRISKKKKNKVPGLKHCPQKRGVVQKVYIETPKKPNSAKRKCIKVKLSTGRVVACHVPGIGHSLSKHSVVMVRGGRCQDLIGIRYKPIRGMFDCRPVANRVTRPTKFGLQPIRKSKK
jgi:small subunit ribosomal protein S12